jgi:hypothetical protein
MTPPPFRAIGGAIVADHGTITLAAARALAVFYDREQARLRPGTRLAMLCARRARALAGAADDATLWRRAAGWTDPEAADRGPTHA